MKKYYYLKRKEQQFQVGDVVYLRLHPYRHMSVAQRKSLKLSPCFYGYFPISLHHPEGWIRGLQTPTPSKIHYTPGVPRIAVKEKFVTKA